MRVTNDEAERHKRPRLRRSARARRASRRRSRRQAIAFALELGGIHRLGEASPSGPGPPSIPATRPQQLTTRCCTPSSSGARAHSTRAAAILLDEVDDADRLAAREGVADMRDHVDAQGRDDPLEETRSARCSCRPLHRRFHLQQQATGFARPCPPCACRYSRAARNNAARRSASPRACRCRRPPSSERRAPSISRPVSAA